MIEYFNIMKIQKKSTKPSKAIWISFFWLIISTPYISGILHNFARFRYIYGSIALIAVYILIKRKKQFDNIFKNNILVFVLVGYIGLSIFWTGTIIESFKNYLVPAATLIIICLIFIEKEPDKIFITIFKRYFIVIILLSILIEFIFRSNSTAALTAVSSHKNSFGILMAISSIFFLWKMGKRKDNKEIGLSILFLVLSFYFLIGSRSIGALGAFVAGSITFLFLMFFKSKKNLKKNILIITILTFLLIVSSAKLYKSYTEYSVLQYIVEKTGRDMTFTGRTNIWDYALKTANQPIFGYGFGGFWNEKRILNAERSINYAAPHSHNGYLEAYLNLGLVGITIITIILLSISKRLIKRFVKLNNHFDILMIILFVSILFSNIFNVGLFSIYFSIEWFIFFFIAIYTKRSNKDQKKFKSIKETYK